MAAKRYSTSRSRKRSPTRRRKKTKKVSRFAWLLGGLVMGLTIAVGGYVLLKKFDSTSSDNTTANIVTTEKTSPEKVTLVGKGQTKPKAETPPKIKKPQYDFYTLLPEMEVTVPDTAPTNSRGGKQRYSYILQAGSFRKASEADSVKAQLALLGVQATIQTLRINDKIWHRVKLGPYNSWSEVKPVRRHLKDNNINFSIIKSKRD